MFLSLWHENDRNSFNCMFDWFLFHRTIKSVRFKSYRPLSWAHVSRSQGAGEKTLTTHLSFLLQTTLCNRIGSVSEKFTITTFFRRLRSLVGVNKEVPMSFYFEVSFIDNYVKTTNMGGGGVTENVKRESVRDSMVIFFVDAGLVRTVTTPIRQSHGIVILV